MPALPPLKIGRWTASVPIIQGGMGVRVSASGLAAAVANEGGIGLVASVALSLNSPHYKKPGDYYRANKLALLDELRIARELSPEGVIGTNCMVAVRDYEAMVRTSVEGGAQVIVSGAGLPLRLPEYAADNPEVALVPIVSSVKAAQVLCRRWAKVYKRLPDALVVEDPNTAGGHLGVDRESLFDPAYNLENVVPDLVAYLEKEWQEPIPVVSAGGIWDRKDIDWAMSLGSAGVQMASRFICTHECDASPAFKMQYIKAKASDIVIVDSPVGLPSRAIRTPFTGALFQGEEVPHKCLANCLQKCFCRDDETHFCIADVLNRAQKGDTFSGLHFAGSNAHRHEAIVSVRDIFDELLGRQRQEQQATA
ncbi:MAG: nitronate monooxygenase [Alphaproteobacteria bacterium CG_4_10_14_0_2_um_filter_63_37]|nr:MAG: nitronate monooxygenase [Alphaproteobacteria bacterium CG_4_10_14_0_2_um_filter_63_37]